MAGKRCRKFQLTLFFTRTTRTGPKRLAIIRRKIIYAQLYLGNASNDATGVAISGDATLANNGNLSLANTGVSAGTYGSTSTVPIITIDAKGRVTSASSLPYQNGSTSAKGVLQVGSNLTVAAGVISMQSSDITSALGYTPMSGTGSAFVNSGNIFSADATLGTNDNYNLFFRTNNVNRMVISNSGSVGIGSGTPSSKLTVAGDVNISGIYYVNGVAINNTNGTVTNVSSANSDIAVATGSTTPILTLNSGTGNNQIVKLTAAGKYPAIDGSLITNIDLAVGVGTSTLPIANGGTNSNTALNNNRIIVSNAGKIVESAAMTDGQILIGATGAAPVASTLTAGNGIIISNGVGTISPAVDAGVGANKIPQVGGVAMAANSIPMVNGTATALIGKTCIVNEILQWNSTAWVCASMNAGSVTSVTGTAPIVVATGSTTPVISITQASSTTNGYLSSTDFTTFNNASSG